VIQNDQIEKHFDVLARILFIYAKLNPGIGYVQGMNEVLAPIYYVMA
jgi:multisubunit Na+/H+ antiporter MnhB subunit